MVDSFAHRAAIEIGAAIAESEGASLIACALARRAQVALRAGNSDVAVMLGDTVLAIRDHTRLAERLLADRGAGA